MLEPIDIARICHEANRAYCAALGDYSQLPWADAPDWQHASAINGVRHHLANPDATPADNHVNWAAEKIAEGWVYGPVKDVVLKQHPCLVAYELLPQEQQRKDALFLAIVRALA